MLPTGHMRKDTNFLFLGHQVKTEMLRKNTSNEPTSKH